jgi:chromosome segregation ATPase
MLKNTLIIALIVLVIYLYYSKNTKTSADYSELQTRFEKVVKINKIFAKFCQQEIGGQDIEEIRTKLNGKKLSELLEELEDYELEVDTLRRTKNELEADLLAQSNSFKGLVKEKEGMVKRLEQEKKQTVKDLENLQQLTRIQSQKVTDLETQIKQREKLFKEVKQTKSDLADYKAEVKRLRESKKELVAKVQALEKEVKAKDIVGPQQLQKFRDTFIACYPKVNPSAQEQVGS